LTNNEGSNSDILEARRYANSLKGSLPNSVSVVALGVKSKAPFQLLAARESLIWRTEELARCACDALERNDISVAALLTRAVIESTGLLWKLKDTLEKRSTFTREELNNILTKILFGSKQQEHLPQAFQILSCIDRLDKIIPNFRKTYDILSEYAHPNWQGVSGLYSKTNYDEFVTYFGRGLHEPDRHADNIIQALIGSIQLFELAYNSISDDVISFLGELESLWSDSSSSGS
jgi:hypothetical protein